MQTVNLRSLLRALEPTVYETAAGTAMHRCGYTIFAWEVASFEVRFHTDGPATGGGCVIQIRRSVFKHTTEQEIYDTPGYI